MRTIRTLFALWWVAMVSGGLCDEALAAPETGWWWNPDESGRGFFVESHDGVTFIGAYLYNDDGHAIWLVSGGPNPDSYNWTGDLYYKTHGQTLFGEYVAPSDAVVVGQIAVHFSDDTHGTVTWPGGMVQIERQIFGTGDAPFQPDNGWWWNPDESGSGYSLEVQGGNLFVVGFMYDDTGQPVWYFSAGPMSSATTYHGDVLQFANGQTMSGAYHPPGPPTKIATLDIEFTAENEASTTFTDASATAKVSHAKAGSRSNTWQPQIPKPGRFVFPNSYTANFDIESAGSPIGLSSAAVTITAASIPMIQSFTAPGAFRQYVQDPKGQATVVYGVSGSAGDCTTSGSLVVDLPLSSVQLKVTSFAKYTLTLNASAAVIPATITCPGPPATTVDIAYPFPGDSYTHTNAVTNVRRDGTHIKGYIEEEWLEDLVLGGHAHLYIIFDPK
ncbi:MAG TPA: hypothetical protein VKG21_15075 [Casimicrobiaceae bacterium]|nr:hypothetical protein [Casimicrobiaceae bacterium]